ncbi:MAG: type 4a pilus biogenesis protein PilO [Patescibacteria group bacterium]
MPIFNMLKNSESIDQDIQGVSDQQNLNVFLIKYYNQLVCLLALLIITAGYFLLIQPKYIEVSESKKVADQQQLEISYLEKQDELDQFIKLEKAYNKIDQKDKEKIEKILPSKVGVEELIAEIESIVLKNGLILTSLSIQSEGGASASLPEGVMSAKISLTVTGTDYLGLKSLLKTIENNVRLMDIQNVGYGGGKSGTNLSLIVYYFK